MFRHHTLHLDHLTVQFDSLTNFDELFDQLLAKGENSEDVLDERIPYWADLWPSAVALSTYLVRSGLVTPDTTVTEIGCGLGLPSVVAGMLGAKEVRFTDYLEDALVYAKHNWDLNCTQQALFQKLDWRHPDPAYAADLLLASDVAYESRFFDDLPQAFRTLCKPGGHILFSEPGRDVAKDFLNRFPQMGFFAKKTVLDVELNDFGFKVGVYELQVTP
ncbi:MAG: 50S ribosomal protein L11 methyltransferase [Lewinellaceae bacterium]|nr:50S ribosomal protein L11 methyltransferase [Lewinellaceae bacterium]